MQTLVGAQENATHTSLQYTRLLDTCHPGEDYALSNGPRWLLFSMSTADPTPPQGSDPDFTFVQHTYTGTTCASPSM